jgi:hypothetical protein
MIEQYRFGEMLIDGRRYRSDLMILPDGRVTDNWRRKEGHRMTLEDIAPLLDCGVQTLVAGTGASGRMIPAPDLKAQLQEADIELICLACNQAVDHYNQLIRNGDPGVAACFHLTC